MNTTYYQLIDKHSFHLVTETNSLKDIQDFFLKNEYSANDFSILEKTVVTKEIAPPKPKVTYKIGSKFRFLKPCIYSEEFMLVKLSDDPIKLTLVVTIGSDVGKAFRWGVSYICKDNDVRNDSSITEECMDKVLKLFMLDFSEIELVK